MKLHEIIEVLPKDLYFLISIYTPRPQKLIGCCGAYNQTEFYKEQVDRVLNKYGDYEVFNLISHQHPLNDTYKSHVCIDIAKFN